MASNKPALFFNAIPSPPVGRISKLSGHLHPVSPWHSPSPLPSTRLKLIRQQPPTKGSAAWTGAFGRLSLCLLAHYPCFGMTARRVGGKKKSASNNSSPNDLSFKSL